MEIRARYEFFEYCSTTYSAFPCEIRARVARKESGVSSFSRHLSKNLADDFAIKKGLIKI
jgi:hypothetical protein